MPNHLLKLLSADKLAITLVSLENQEVSLALIIAVKIWVLFLIIEDTMAAKMQSKRLLAENLL